jgi:hypothetical protein
MSGKHCKDSSPAHTAAAALYGWKILQIGDTFAEYDGMSHTRNILCSGKPAMTLVRENDPDHLDMLYVTADILPENLCALLAERERAEKDMSFLRISPSKRRRKR